MNFNGTNVNVGINSNNNNNITNNNSNNNFNKINDMIVSFKGKLRSRHYQFHKEDSIKDLYSLF